MMTAEQLDGLIAGMTELNANGFGPLKDEIKICQYIMNYGEAAKE